MQNDKPGVVAEISNTIAEDGVNIAEMSTSRSEKGGTAMTIITTDTPVGKDVVNDLNKLNNIRWVRILPKLE